MTDSQNTCHSWASSRATPKLAGEPVGGVDELLVAFAGAVFGQIAERR